MAHCVVNGGGRKMKGKVVGHLRTWPSLSTGVNLFDPEAHKRHEGDESLWVSRTKLST